MTGLFQIVAPMLAQVPKAKGAAAPAAGGGGDGGAIQTMAPYLYLVPIALLFYFMVLRPQQLQERKRRAMIDALKKNDQVLTSAGIYGTVVSVDGKEDKIVLKVGDGVKMTFSKASITRVVELSDKKETAASAAD
jgi:preprotein translocase subunit YajC